MGRSPAVSIVTGFATPGGLAAISGPLKAQPQKLRTLIVGAGTYPGFEALDDLLAVGVPPDRRTFTSGTPARLAATRTLSPGFIRCSTARSTTWSCRKEANHVREPAAWT